MTNYQESRMRGRSMKAKWVLVCREGDEWDIITDKDYLERVQGKAYDSVWWLGDVPDQIKVFAANLVCMKKGKVNQIELDPT